MLIIVLLYIYTMLKLCATGVPNMEKYTEFEDWWNEVESFSLRSERFHESMQQFSESGKIVNFELWLRAAFDAARKCDEVIDCTQQLTL